MAIAINLSGLISIPATVTFLEMRERPREEELIFPPDTRFELISKPVSVEVYREYYYGVGEKFHWLDRMVMPDDELYEKINSENTDIYIMLINGEYAGFAEFVKEKEFTEILYFGLFPEFVGKGLGSAFLRWVIRQAWSNNPTWIQLNTCSLDHPGALPVYTKAGFIPVRTEIQQRKMLKKD